MTNGYLRHPRLPSRAKSRRSPLLLACMAFDTLFAVAELLYFTLALYLPLLGAFGLRDKFGDPDAGSAASEAVTVVFVVLHAAFFLCLVSAHCVGYCGLCREGLGFLFPLVSLVGDCLMRCACLVLFGILVGVSELVSYVSDEGGYPKTLLILPAVFYPLYLVFVCCFVHLLFTEVDREVIR